MNDMCRPVNPTMAAKQPQATISERLDVSLDKSKELLNMTSVLWERLVSTNVESVNDIPKPHAVVDKAIVLEQTIDSLAARLMDIMKVI